MQSNSIQVKRYKTSTEKGLCLLLDQQVVWQDDILATQYQNDFKKWLVLRGTVLLFCFWDNNPISYRSQSVHVAIDGSQ